MKSRLFSLLLTCMSLTSACDLFAPTPRIASIDLTADTDTLTAHLLPQPIPEIHVTATPKDAGGATIRGKTAVWSSLSPSVTVTSTGPLTATLTLNRVDRDLVGSVEVLASIDTFIGRMAIVKCPAYEIAAKHSGSILVGRTVLLAGTVYGDAGSNALNRPIRCNWTSAGVRQTLP